MLPGVRRIIRFASTPTATICPLLVLSATTLGSFKTMPRPRTYTRGFAVPRSTAMSRPRNVIALLIGNGHLPIRHAREILHELRTRPLSSAVSYCQQLTGRAAFALSYLGRYGGC